MDNGNPCSLKLRRALTDIGKFSTDDDRCRSRQFPRLFKQTSFVSTLFPNFNKNFRLSNSWTTPEISRANKIVVEHLKSRTHLRYLVNEFSPTEPVYGADLQNQARATFLKRINNEVNDPLGENVSNISNESNKWSSKRLLILPKLEKDFHFSNNYKKEHILRLLYKRNTSTETSVTSTTDNNGHHSNNTNKRGELIAYCLNKTERLRDFHRDSNLIDNPTSCRGLLGDNGGRLLEICNANPLSNGSTAKQHFSQENYEGYCRFPSTERELKKTLPSPTIADTKHRDLTQDQGNETASSSPCNNHDKKAKISVNNHLNRDLSILPLENDFSSLADDQLRQDGVCHVLNEILTKEVSVYDGESSSTFFSSQNKETSSTDDTEVSTSLKDDFLILPAYDVHICNNGVTTKDTQRKVYHGDIAHPISSNNKLFRICVWADRDMSEECAAFQNNLFPRLRHLGQKTGIEIELIDLHLNQSDPTCLDNFRLELFTKILDKCLESEGQSRFVVLLGEKYGHPILPSTIPSREFKPLQRQLIQRSDSQTQDNQRPGVLGDLRPPSRGSHRSRVDSASSGHLLKPPSNYQGKSCKSISRVGTPTDKSPRGPAIFISNVGDERASHVINGPGVDRTHASDRSGLIDLYRADDQGGQNVYRLKVLRLSESENDKWKKQIRTVLELLSKLNSTPEKEKYQQSLLHAVLSSASRLSKTTAADDHFVCVTRNVTNMADSLQTWIAHQYFDINADKNEINRELTQKMKDLRSHVVSSKVPPGNLVELQLDLQEGAVRSLRQRQFSLYAERMQDKLYERLATDITNSVQNEPEDAVLREVLLHVTFCQQRVRDSCLIQKPIIRAIMTYVTSIKPHVFILYGPDGSGKTTLMSLAAVHLKVWTESFHSKTHVLVRVIGCTRDSTNICDLLYGLCIQLQDIFHISASVPTDYTGLINQFSHLLSCACVNEKLAIFLDGLDLLEGSPEITLQWVPKELPQHVRLVISTRSQEKHGYLKFLQKTLDQSDIFKEIVSLDQSEDVEALTSMLQKRHKQTVSPETKSAITAQFQTRVLFPLNLVLFVMESFSSENMLNTTETSGFDPDVKQMIIHKFSELEQQFNRTFVQRVLGYLTTATFGLSFNELEAVLAIDKTLMTPGHSSFSQLSSYQLLSFLSVLQPYLQESVDGNCRVLRWSHQIFYEAVEERYLKKQAQTLTYHKNLAKIFTSDLPVFSNNKPEMLPGDHPLFKNCGESLSKTYFNYRKLKELPYHLVRSQQTETFKKKIIFSFEWMQAELCATSFASVMRLREEAESFEPQNLELSLLITFLRLSEPVLKRSPDQLTSQLIGRLSFLSSDTINTSPGDSSKYPNLRQLIDNARRSPFPALLPAVTCLAEPEDELPIHLYGHVAPINALDLTADGEFLLTASNDDSIKVWGMGNGRVVRSIGGIGASVFSLIWAVNDTCAVTVEPGSIRVWLLADQKCLYRFDSGSDSLVIVAVSNADFVRSALLVAIYDGSNKLNVWDLQDGSCQTHSIGLIGKRVHQSRSVLLARNCQSNCFLYSFRDSNEAALQNAINGNIVFYLNCKESASTVVGVAVTPNYLVLACRQLYLKSKEIHQLELFNPNNGLYLRKVRGCVHDIVSSSLVVPSTGSSILTLGTSQQNNVSNVIVWNLETEGHKHLAKHPGISDLLACDHIRRVLTASRGGNYIKQWDLSVKISQTAPEIKSVSSISQIKFIDNKPDYFVTLTSNNGPVGLWTFNRVLNNIHTTTANEFLDPSDVVLVNKTKLVILSERSLPSITDDVNQVFQSILIYNMETGCYDIKLSGCYIDIFPTHDYAILPGDRLMGLSTSRSHFIIWSLTNGQVIQRIKLCCKDLNWAHEIGSRGFPKYIQARWSAVNMTPWEQRSETESARAERHEREREDEIRRRHELKKEKENPVDGFLLSGNRQILLVSYFAHHLCVFEIETQRHLTTVEDENAMLFLNVSALTADGLHFVHATYDENGKTGYVTLRDSRSGRVKRRLKNEKDVCAVALTDSTDRVVMAKHTNEIHIWDPMVTNSLRKRKLSKSMKLDFDSRLFLMDNGQRAVLLAGQISVWDLDRGELLATFTPDSKLLCCNVISQGNIILLGLSEEIKPIVLSVQNAGIKALNT